MADLRGIPCTRHAMVQLRDRAERLHGCVCNFDKLLEKILSSAKLGNNNIGHYKRRTRLYGDTEMYISKGGWRVIVAVDLETQAKSIVTIEHINPNINKEAR